MSFSENLRKLRKDNNMSQEKFAEKIGVSRQAVSKWESDEGYLKVEKLLIISQEFNVSPNSLLDWDIPTNEKETSVSSETNAIPVSALSVEEMDKIAQEVVKKSVNPLLFDDCMVAIRDNMVIDWYKDEHAQRKMRLALSRALPIDICFAKNTSEKIVENIVSTIQKQIPKATNPNSSN